MKQLLIMTALLFTINIYAQTTRQDSLLLKAGKQGTASTVLPIITALITAPLLTNIDKPDVFMFYSSVNGISIVVSYVLRLSAWGNIKKAARVNDLKQKNSVQKIPLIE
jgi:hypothetical protein